MFNEIMKIIFRLFYLIWVTLATIINLCFLKRRKEINLIKKNGEPIKTLKELLYEYKDSSKEERALAIE